ncbi:lysophospholipid acyltransferase family protein [Hymenobacter amundsenii]|nr:lysophospholipid acyltransferase family protein [Hymenobacter amundsenii]
MDVSSDSRDWPAGSWGRASLGPRQPVGQPWAQLRELRDLGTGYHHLNGREFIGQLLRDLRITVTFDAAELRQVPERGAFVALANQQGGLLEALVLLHVLGEVRPELVAVANEVLAPLLPCLPRQQALARSCQPAARPSAPTVARLLSYLHNDLPLGLFATGPAAPRTRLFRVASNPARDATASQLLTHARVPVLPVCLSVSGRPVRSLQRLLLPLLRFAHLPAEVLRRQGQTVHLRIGARVSAAALVQLPAAKRLPHLLARAAALATGAAQSEEAPAWPPAAPVPAVPAALLEADLAALRPNRRLLRHGRWEVYLAKQTELPHVLPEIGRLRELGARAADAGTGQALDLDGYDTYYRHLLLYDREARQLVGACRVGRGRNIMREMGKRGFYLHSLYGLKKEMRPLLRESLEVGRAFIRAEYQAQPLPPALLWKGVAEYLALHPEYRYLIGTVNLSNQFPDLSKTALATRLAAHISSSEALAPFVLPRKTVRYRPLASAATATPGCSAEKLPELPDSAALMASWQLPGVPELLRPYLKQQVHLLGFHLDPRGNTLEGLLLLDARELPARTHQLLRRYGAARNS